MRLSMATAHEDIVDTLLAQHREIRMLFEDIEKAEGRTKQELFQDRLREVVSEERLARLVPAMKAVQAMAPTRPHLGVRPRTRHSSRRQVDVVTV
jgi:hypothetical protein